MLWKTQIREQKGQRNFQRTEEINWKQENPWYTVEEVVKK